MKITRFFPFAIAATLSVAACGEAPPAEQDVDNDVTADVPDALAEDTDPSDDTGIDALDDVLPDADTDETDDVAGDPSVDVPTTPEGWESAERSTEQSDLDVPNTTPETAASPGLAELSQVSDASGFVGPDARCRPGDFVLENEHLRACVAGVNAPNQYTYAGGYLVDLMPADATNGEMLEALVPGLELSGMVATDITPVRDGSDGGEAVVRVTGALGPLAVIGNFVGMLGVDRPLTFETEYRLGPDDRAVEAVTWVAIANENVSPGRITAGDVIFSGDHVITFDGVDTAGMWAGVSRDASYGIWSESIEVTPFARTLLDAEIAIAEMASGRLAFGQEGAYTRYYSVAEDVATLRANFDSVAPRSDLTAVTFEGPVGEAHPERRYVISDAEGTPVTVVRLDDSGAASALLAPGNYTARRYDLDEDTTTIATFDAGDDTVALQAPDTGLLRVWIDTPTDEGATPSPGFVRVRGPVNVEHFVLRGADAIPLPPGTYRVDISRGEGFDLSTHLDVVVPSGDEVMVETTLTPTLDIDGWSSGDFHQHSRRSVDSSIWNDRLVAANLAAGVTILAPTDHDIIADYPGLVERLGVDDLVHVYNGTEISPFWAHINAFPMAYDLTKPRFGGVALSTFDGDDVTEHVGIELVTQARTNGAEIIQINHPRDSSGYLDSANYDPVTGPTETDPDVWVSDFDSIEVVNGMDDTCKVMRDWFSLLSHGMRVAGMGNSDTHSIGSPGWPRNYLATGINDPAALTNDAIAQAIRGLRVSVSGGLFIDFPDGAFPGDTLFTPDDTLDLRVRVQSPAWTAASTLITYVNGVEYDRRPLSADASELVDFDEQITLPADADAHIVFFAYANTRMQDVTPGKQAFGFTNPVFIDAGNDGWEAPGVADESDAPLPVLPFCSAD